MVGMLAIGLVAVLVFAPVATWLRTRPSPNDPVLPPARLRPVTTWIVLAVLLALGLRGAARMRFFTTMSDMFMKGDEVGSMLAFFDRRFGGNEFVQIDVQGDLRDPGVAARVMRVTDLIEGSRAFADVRSITQILGFMNRGLTGVYRIPGDRDSLNNVWFFLDGQDDIRALVAEDRHEAMIVGRVPTGTTDPAHLVDVVNDAIERSAKVGPDVARARLQALSATFRVPLSPQRLDETLAAAQAAEAPADAAE